MTILIAAVIFAVLVLEVPIGSIRSAVMHASALVLFCLAGAVGAHAGTGGTIAACIMTYVLLSLTGALDALHEPYP